MGRGRVRCGRSCPRAGRRGRDGYAFISPIAWRSKVARTTVKPWLSRNFSISFPLGRGKLGTGKLFEVQIEMSQGHGRRNSRQGIFDSKGFDVAAGRFLRIGDRVVFGLPLSISRNIGKAGRETSHFQIGNKQEYREGGP